MKKKQPVTNIAGDYYQRILLAGTGGQGIIVLGRLLAKVAISTVPNITFFPDYGIEVRGGMSNCQVIFATREIASPVSSEFDMMIVMERISATTYLPCRAPGGLALVNSSMCPGVTSKKGVVCIPATTLADKMGDTRIANVIMLGALLARRPVVRPESIETEITRMLGSKNPDMLRLNIKAFQTGLTL